MTVEKFPKNLRLIAWLTLVSMFPWTSVAVAASGDVSAAVNPTSLSDEAPDSRADDRTDVVIAPGFQLQLSSTQDAKLNGHYRVRSDGTVLLPYGITISTDGMTLGRFQEAVINQYRPLFTRVPKVNVTIRQKRYWIDVGGIVSRPGVYLVAEDSSLDEVISTAGGLTEDSARGFARIESSAGIHWVDLDEYFKHGKTDIPAWQGREHVFFQISGPDDENQNVNVAQMKKVRVIGEVKNPGELTYRKKGDGFYYLGATGGPTQFSDLDHVQLVRTDLKTGARQVSYQPISQITDVHESDMLIVPPVHASTSEKALTITAIVVGIVSASLLAFVAVRGTK